MKKENQLTEEKPADEDLATFRKNRPKKEIRRYIWEMSPL